MSACLLVARRRVVFDELRRTGGFCDAATLQMPSDLARIVNRPLSARVVEQWRRLRAPRERAHGLQVGKKTVGGLRGAANCFHEQSGRSVLGFYRREVVSENVTTVDGGTHGHERSPAKAKVSVRKSKHD